MQGKVHTDAMSPVYVGIDVCKARLDVYLHPIGEHFSVANDAGGWRRLQRQMSKHTVELVVMEATSKYHRAAHRHLDAAGFRAPSSIRCGPGCSLKRAAPWPRPIRSMHACSL